MAVPRLERTAVVTVPVLLTVAHVAEVLDCHPRTVRRRIDDGILPAVIEHSTLKVRGDDLRAYIEALERPSAAPARRRKKPRASVRFDFLGSGAATLDRSNTAPRRRANGPGHGPQEAEAPMNSTHTTPNAP